MGSSCWSESTGIAACTPLFTDAVGRRKGRGFEKASSPQAVGTYLRGGTSMGKLLATGLLSLSWGGCLMLSAGDSPREQSLHSIALLYIEQSTHGNQVTLQRREFAEAWRTQRMSSPRRNIANSLSG